MYLPHKGCYMGMTLQLGDFFETDNSAMCHYFGTASTARNISAEFFIWGVAVLFVPRKDLVMRWYLSKSIILMRCYWVPLYFFFAKISWWDYFQSRSSSNQIILRFWYFYIFNQHIILHILHVIIICMFLLTNPNPKF